MLFRGLKYPLRFFRSKRALVTENIHELGKLPLSRLRNHLLTYDLNILLCAALEFFWDPVSSEQGGHDGPRPVGGCLPDRLQRLQFRLDREPIAGFGFHGSRAVSGHVFQHRYDLGGQGSLSRIANTLEARTVSAASGRNLFVSSAFDALLEIHQPRAVKDRVGVRIHKAWENIFARAVDLGNLAAILLQPGIAQRFLRGADGNDFPPPAQDSPFFDDAQFLQVGTTARTRAARGRPKREKLADIG